MAEGIDQARLDALFTAALEAAIARIEKDGTFFPLVFELRANGAIQNVAVLEANYAADVLVPFEIASSGLLGHQRQLTLGSFTARPAANDLF